ncbi:methyltransferase [Actinomadura sp. J1-007]|nr:methyltransferase [Actinomadura sp. J1-007]
MFLMRPPGVYRPQGDTELLCEALERSGALPGARVLDVGTGTGAVALAAARGGAARVTAIDVSARALLTARFNAFLRGVRINACLGDLFGPVAGEAFDVVLANPPYVLSGGNGAIVRGSARAWDGGTDGRTVLDRVCADAPAHLAPGGTLLLVHSALSGVRETLRSLRAGGLRAAVVARRPEPFGPVMRAQAALLEARRVIEPGQRHEDLVVIRADRVPTGSGAHPPDDGRRIAAVEG